MKPTSAIPKAKVEEVILQTLRKVLDYECEILENTEEIAMNTEALHKQLKSHADKRN